MTRFDPGSDQIEKLSVTLTELEADLEQGRRDTERSSYRASLFVYSLILLMGILALVNLYYINALFQEFGQVASNMRQMNDHISQVSGTMTDIRGSMTRMEQSVRMMPIIGEQMAEIGGDVASMGTDLEQMRDAVGSMDRRVADMDHSLWDMAHQFRALNGAVGRMGVDVNQMSRPVP